MVALAKLIFLQDTEVFPALLSSTFDMAKTGFEISLYLTGVMSLWLGLMKIGEQGGMVRILSKLVGPFFARLFPGVPRDHPANGSIIMNFSANILGLDNAATPLGLKAMQQLQELNPNKDTASNAQITFLVLNASGLTVIPLAIIADRASIGIPNPTSIFLPTLIATFVSTMAGLLYLAYARRGMGIDQGAQWVREKLSRTWRKLAPQVQALAREQYDAAMKSVTVRTDKSSHDF